MIEYKTKPNTKCKSFQIFILLLFLQICLKHNKNFYTLDKFFENILLFMTVKVKIFSFSLPSLAAPLR